jgi:hypothetical protein
MRRGRPGSRACSARVTWLLAVRVFAQPVLAGPLLDGG